MADAHTLRQYQLDVIAKTHAEISSGHKRVLLVAPTGAGKTVIAGQLIRDYVDTGKRVLFLAHRRELITQASHKLYDVGIDHGIIQAGFPTRPSEKVQIASIQTLHARAIRTTVMDLPASDLIVIDECHHARSMTYTSIVEQFPNADVIGLTATPCRGDGRGLGNSFDVIVECPPIADMVTAGFLVPTKVYAPSKPDLAGVKVARGDYAENQLAERMNTAVLVGDIVTHWHRLGEGRKTVVFATGVEHSVHLRDEFRKSGVLAEHIDGTTPAEERDKILKQLADGRVDLISNAMVLTEGWDCPDVSCLVLARPTKSVGLYRQMVGRVLRPAPSKTDALIIDHAGAVFEHGFIDEPIEWTLSHDKKAVSKTQSARVEGQLPKLTECPECKAVRWAGKPCGSCGWRPVSRGTSQDIVDADLEEIDRQTKTAVASQAMDRERFHAQLMWIVNERNYKPGWAAMKFKEKFGAWPKWGAMPTPIPPDPEVRSWVRSRQIAWARAQDKSRAG